MVKNIKHIHFMGIGGSALAGVAVLAKNQGFKVTGCDLVAQTAYSKILEKAGIKVLQGHDKSHLDNVDLLAVSPAVLINSPNHPEIIEAKKAGILITWQEFLGKYLQEGKKVIGVCGTHGKSTTTAMLGLILEQAGLDPTVEVGALVDKWSSSIRQGNSDYFVCEADEFNNNFLNYHPGFILINNIEMDHPEFFKDEEEFSQAFANFIKNIKPPKVLVVNEESQGVHDLLNQMKDWLKDNQVKVIGYYLKKPCPYPFDLEYQAEIIKQDKHGTEFRINDDTFYLKATGLANLANALGALACAFELGVKAEDINQALSNFTGLSRRFELIGEGKGIKVFDDYAVHPTAVASTMQAAKQKYPDSKIWAVFEPHQFSRLKLFANQFASVLSEADKVVVARAYVGREKDQGNGQSEELARKIGIKAVFLPEFEQIADYLNQEVKKREIIIVFGAGNSYLLSKMIVEKLNS